MLIKRMLTYERPKLAACDPCRHAKVACDHERPVCTRCRDGRISKCTYRDRPFKRARTQIIQQQSALNKSCTDTLLGSNYTTSVKYSNPGYLGSSSATTIFNHIPPENNPETDAMEVPRVAVVDSDVSRSSELLKQAYESGSSCARLLEAWITKGVNFALAGPFTSQCTKTAEYVLTNDNLVKTKALRVSSALFSRSALPLNAEATSTIEDFASSFCLENAVWETLGLFYTAVSRAAVDAPTIRSPRLQSIRNSNSSAAVVPEVRQVSQSS